MEYFLAFYIAGMALAMFRLYRPSYLTIKEIDPNNILIRKNVIAFFVMIVGFAIILLGIIPALLSDKFARNFISSFVQSVLNRGV